MISEIAVTTKTAEGDSYLIESFEGSQIIAKKQGMEIVHSTKERLLLDLDTGAQQDQYRNMLRRLKNIKGLKGLSEKERWASKSGTGVHVVLELPRPFSVTERLLLQCCLGSDPMREALGLFLLLSGEENPIMLFKPAAESRL